jgi:adenylate kinase
MAPTSEDLHQLVNKLEARVKQLEEKLQHAQGGSKPAGSDGVRMILMGPPGAGMFVLCDSL